MKAFPLGLVIALIFFIFAPVRGDDSIYAPASGGFAVEQKLKALIVSVDFNNATIEQATEALTVMSRQLDPSHKGVGFVLQPEAVVASRPITLKLDSVPLGETLRYVCELANLRYRADEHLISILPHASNEGLVKRTFHVDPSFVETARQAGIIPQAQMSP